NVELDTVNSKR
ncbi:unnamed protein product, partial [Allacma fusca]